MAGRFSSPYGIGAATVITLPQELDILHVDIVAVAGLTALGLVGAGLQPALYIYLLPLGQVLVAGLRQFAPGLKQSFRERTGPTCCGISMT